MVDRMGSKKVFAVAAALLLLTGCASTPEEASDAQADATAVEEVEAAPLVAEEAAPEPGTPEAAYLELVRQYEARDPLFVEASDEELVAAGKLACEQMSGGTEIDDVRVVDGEQPDSYGVSGVSRAIAVVARDTLC